MYYSYINNKLQLKLYCQNTLYFYFILFSSWTSILAAGFHGIIILEQRWKT